MRLHGIESYIAVPLNRRDGTYFGTLCALDPLPAELTEDSLQIFHLLANLIAFELEAVESERRARAVAEQMAAQARELARFEERERIAMDLHDGVIQSLYSVVLGLGAHEIDERRPGDDQVLSQTIARLSDVIHEIRNNILYLNVRYPAQSDSSLCKSRTTTSCLRSSLLGSAISQPPPPGSGPADTQPTNGATHADAESMARRLH